MTDRLTEIRSRLDAATPGPWYADWPIRIVCADGSWDRAGYSVVEFGDEPDQSDTTFIEHAPADIAWLLDRVEALEYVVESQRIKPLDHDPTAKRCRCVVCHRAEVAP